MKGIQKIFTAFKRSRKKDINLAAAKPGITRIFNLFDLICEIRVYPRLKNKIFFARLLILAFL